MGSVQIVTTILAAAITAVAAELCVPLTHDRALADAKKVDAYGTPSDNFRGGKLGAAIRADAYSAPPRAQDRDNNPLTTAWQS